MKAKAESMADDGDERSKTVADLGFHGDTISQAIDENQAFFFKYNGHFY